jgi:RNA polymerase sigma-70 factor (ECF subfamily)
MLKFAATLSDNELLRLMIGGDGAAFGEIYRRHHLSIYRFARLMSDSKTIAEDVTQEVFMTLIREVSRFDPERGSLQAFLYGIARNHVKRFQKRERFHVALVDESENHEDTAVIQLIAPDNPMGELARNETIKLVRRAVLNLPSRYREVVVLCDFQEMSYAEAADVLGCPIGTINSRLHRAHSLLLKKLRAVMVKSDASASDEQIMRCFA